MAHLCWCRHAGLHEGAMLDLEAIDGLHQHRRLGTQRALPLRGAGLHQRLRSQCNNQGGGRGDFRSAVGATRHGQPHFALVLPLRPLTLPSTAVAAVYCSPSCLNHCFTSALLHVSGGPYAETGHPIFRGMSSMDVHDWPRPYRIRTSGTPDTVGAKQHENTMAAGALVQCWIQKHAGVSRPVTGAPGSCG